MTTSDRVLGESSSPAQQGFSWADVAKTAAATKRGAKTKAKGEKALGVRAMADQSIWQQFQRVGGALNPQQLSSILREADTGRVRRLIDLGNDARQKDCHLASVLTQSEETIAGLDWKLALPEKSLRREQKILTFINDHLRFTIAQEFNDLLAHLAGAVYYSFAVAEMEWAKDGGKLVPVAFHKENARRFTFRDTDSKLVWQDENMRVGVDFLDAHPNKFVVAQPRVTGDVASREGLIRVLMWAALFRSWSFTDWLRTGEIAWKPWRVAKYKKSASKEDIDGLYALLERLASTGGAVIPESADLNIEWAGGSGGGKPTHSELCNVIAQEMSKAALGQTETTQSSDSTGYAQAKVHYAVRANILRARARFVAAVISKYVIGPMVMLNFGDTFEIPRFEFITQEPVDLKGFSEGLRNLTGPQGAGLAVPANWARQIAGIPNPATGDELMGVPPAAGNDGSDDAPKPAPAKPAAPPAKGR